MIIYDNELREITFVFRIYGTGDDIEHAKVKKRSVIISTADLLKIQDQLTALIGEPMPECIGELKKLGLDPFYVVPPYRDNLSRELVKIKIKPVLRYQVLANITNTK